MHIQRLLTASVLLIAALVTSANAADPITLAQLPELRALIRPQAFETTWNEIPWLTSLWQARQRAAAEGKPILLWEMDGHPLGCT